MKRDVFELEDEKEEPFVAEKQAKFIVDEQVVKAYWQNRATLEAFRIGILPRINPFLAMQVFAYEPSISLLLADDKTPEQQILWKSYLKNIMTNPAIDMNKLREKFDKAPEIFRQSPQLITQYQTILTIVQKFENWDEISYRHLFMWMWLLYRLISKEITNDANMELGSLHLSVKNIAVQAFFIENPFKFVVESNAKVQYPIDMNVVANFLNEERKSRVETFFYDEMSWSNKNFNKAFAFFLYLPADKQYIVFKQAAPILNVLYCLSVFYGLAILDFDPTKRYGQNLLLIVSRLVQQLPKYIGQEPLTFDFFQQQFAIVQTTYPSNPDVGPGIFTGASICSNCSETSNLQACSGCYSAIYCSSTCQEADWQAHALICGQQPPLQQSEMDYLTDYIMSNTALRKLGETDTAYKARLAKAINNLKQKERMPKETDETYAQRILKNVKRNMQAAYARQEKQKASSATLTTLPKASPRASSPSPPSGGEGELLQSTTEMEEMSALFRSGLVTAKEIEQHVRNLILVEMDMMTGMQGTIKERGIYETVQQVLQKYEDSLSAGEEYDLMDKDTFVIYDLKRENVFVSHEMRSRSHWVKLWPI